MGETRREAVDAGGVEPPSPARQAGIFPLDDAPEYERTRRSPWLRGRESNPHGRRLTADRSTFELPRSASLDGETSLAASERVLRAHAPTLITPCCHRAAECGRVRPSAQAVARPGVEPGSTGSEPAILPLDHRAIRNTHAARRCPPRALRGAVGRSEGT